MKMAANPQEEDEERLLDDVVVMVDVTSSEIRNIVVRQLENWGVLHYPGRKARESRI